METGERECRGRRAETSRMWSATPDEPVVARTKRGCGRPHQTRCGQSHLTRVWLSTPEKLDCDALTVQRCGEDLSAGAVAQLLPKLQLMYVRVS
eukprot:109598-Chlamydomonas_euryale.AAC.3